MIFIRGTSGIETESSDGFKVFGSGMNEDGQDEFKFCESLGEVLTVRFIRKSNRSSIIVYDSAC